MTWREQNETIILTPHGNLHEGPESDALERELEGLAERGAREVVVDLAETGHLSARAIGILARMQQRMISRGAFIALRGLHKDQKWLLDVTHVAEVVSEELPQVNGSAA